jgi:hypothetical protein
MIKKIKNYFSGRRGYLVGAIVAIVLLMCFMTPSSSREKVDLNVVFCGDKIVELNGSVNIPKENNLTVILFIVDRGNSNYTAHLSQQNVRPGQKISLKKSLDLAQVVDDLDKVEFQISIENGQMPIYAGYWKYDKKNQKMMQIIEVWNPQWQKQRG